MITTTTPRDEAEQQERDYIEAIRRNRLAWMRLSLAFASAALVLACSLLSGVDSALGLVLVSAALAVLLTAAASYQFGESYWWLRIVYIFAAVQVAGTWIIRLG